MSRVFRMILLSSVAATGCVAAEGDESFVIQSVLSPPTDECAFLASTAGPFLSRGFTGIGASEFLIAAQFESRVQAAEGRESLRTVFVEGANIELQVSPMLRIENNVSSFDPSTEQTIQFQTRFSSAIPPNGGLAIGVFPLIPPDVMAGLRQAAGSAVTDRSVATSIEVNATITAFADFYGDRIDSTSFQFAVDVTNQNIEILGLCPLPQDTTIPEPATGCFNFGQNLDPCCVADTGEAICPPTFEPDA